MQNKAFSKILILIILAVLAGGGILTYQYWWLPKEEAKNHAISEAKIKEISIQKPNLVITGENLSEVKIYMVPTGTGIDPETMSQIENATKQSENNGEQVWIYQYPENLLITNIFAKGFDNNGNLVGRIDLPVIGATALWDALYGIPDETADWQTYRNEEYRFEIRYPKWWNIYELNGQILFQDTPLEDIPNEWFSINTKNDEYDFSSYDFSKEEIVDKITGKEEINISNVNGFRYTFYPKSELYILRKYIILNYKGRGWVLSYSGLSPGLESQILSAFRFLE